MSTAQMERLSAVIARIFTATAPCTGYGRAVPVYTDPETGRGYCLPCLEDAVQEAEAELREERQEIARLACWGRQIAA